PRTARAAGRLAGGGAVAADALDGDVRRLRHRRGGGDDGDPVGDRPVRPAGGSDDVSGDAFHLTPHDVRKQDFRRSLRGYEPLGVEDFRVRVADELERILREKSVLEERLAALGEQVAVYRERERAMNEALVAAQQLRVETRIPYGDLPGFPLATVESHAGELLLGTLAGRRVVAMRGRFHCYEGYTPQQIGLPVRVLARLGARTLMVSNACGGMHPLWSPGDLMLIADHINLLGSNPLVGPNDDRLGPRFPDMSEAYDS